MARRCCGVDASEQRTGAEGTKVLSRPGRDAVRRVAAAGCPAGDRPQVWSLGRACDRAERGTLNRMVKQKVDLLALRNDERAALLLVALRGDF